MSAKRVLSQKHKGKKGLAAFLFSRFFLFGLMVVLQVLMFVFFAYNASVEKNLNYVIEEKSLIIKDDNSIWSKIKNFFKRILKK